MCMRALRQCNIVTDDSQIEDHCLHSERTVIMMI